MVKSRSRMRKLGKIKRLLTPEYKLIYELMQEKEDLKKLLGQVIEKYLNLKCREIIHENLPRM